MSAKMISGIALVIALFFTLNRGDAAPLSRAWTYQGQLKLGGVPLNGTADFEFQLWDDCAAGSLVANAAPQPSNVSVINGFFIVSLDFGANAFNGDARCLAISVRSPAGGGVFTPLGGRQPVTVAPYALETRGIFVEDAGNVGIGDLTPAAKLTVGNGDKFQVSGADGDVTFTDDQASMTFPAADAANSPMIQMFASGTGNGNRMVIAHSPSNTNWGLQYQDIGDEFHFLSGGDDVMNVDLGNQRVGIGATNPASKLHVEDTTSLDVTMMIHNTDNSGSERLYFGTSTGTDAGMIVWGSTNASTPGKWRFFNNKTSANYDWITNGGVRMTLANSGDLGIGTSAPDVKLHIDGGTDTEPGSGGYLVTGNTAGLNISIDNNEIMARNNGATATLFLNNDGGAVRVPVLEITGADMAEKFPVSEVVTPGMVVQIDRNNPGQLCLARGAYNRLVAGVVSGANGLSVGVVLGHLPGLEEAPPIAMSGRVWVHCDVSSGAIESGDSLTTSDTPGHAMKVVDYDKAQGAVIGKAMTSLSEGDGLVLVLVSLQ